MFVKAMVKVVKLAHSSLSYVMIFPNNSCQARNPSITQPWQPLMLFKPQKSQLLYDKLPFFVDVIYDKHKSVKASSFKHPHVKSSNNYGCFNKCKKHVPFHGFVHHVWDNFISELSFAKKHNPTKLMKRKAQQNVFSGA
jgi:hypothetical protein